jgi:FkbM family methyltransferase
MDKHRLVRALDRPGTRWAAQVVGTAVMSSRGRELCVVRSIGDGVYSHKGRRATFVRSGPTSTPPSVQEAETLDAFCCAYMPQPGDIVLAIGAGLGEEAVTFSRLVGPTGRVICVEAHPWTFAQLQRACALNALDNVIPVQRAVSDRGGTILIDDGVAGDTGWSGARIGAGETQVEATTIDELTAALDRVDLLTMNIEGAEQLAIRGMRDSLAKVRHVVVSCHDFVLEPGYPGGDPRWFATYDTVSAFFRDAGFVLGRRRDDDPRAWLRYHMYASSA